LPAGLDAKVHALAGRYRRRSGIAAGLGAEAERIDSMAGAFRNLDDHHLHERLMELHRNFRRGGRNARELLSEALAAVREAAHRQLGLRPFQVQLMGALALHRGCLAEMATGEGKTLTAGLAAVLAGWSGRPCHVVTVNDYLVERDAEWMRPLYAFCGVRVGWVTGAMPPPERRKGYEADVTYVTGKELLADFLRDRLRLGNATSPTRRLIRELLRPEQPVDAGVVMRGLHTAIVDEADSVLIDEAVTPLIIAAPQPNPLLETAVVMARDVAESLEPETHYRLDARHREIELLTTGREKLDEICHALPGLWRGIHRRDELVRQALVAREFFLRDKQYIIADGKIVIVDESTGRPMAQRTWRQGLHQAIEARERVTISAPSETIARLSFQRFFRCFQRLSGMTGTGREAEAELWHIYKLPVITIPTNRPCLREHWPDAVFPDESSKWRAVVAEVRRLHSLGRPVLVGTRSVQASEKLAQMLDGDQLDCKVLNAARLKEEAVIIALAGGLGRITIATNMAGRGTDIKLDDGVARLGGLHVLATERHESPRVDRQLYGRAARQGDPGSAQAFVSLEDELIRRYLPRGINNLIREAARRQWPAWRRMAALAFSESARRAGNLAFQQRQALLKSDTSLDERLSFAGANPA
jgi:preprotein translocase subunit SecA